MALLMCAKHRVMKRPIGPRRRLRCNSCYAERQQQWRKDNIPNYGSRPRDFSHLAQAGAATRFKVGEGVGESNKRWLGGKHAKLGISAKRFREMEATQDGKCAACGRIPSKGRKLCVDHNHTTGAVRGLLCFRCNYGLGWFKDDAQVLTALSNYLAAERDWRDLKCP